MVSLIVAYAINSVMGNKGQIPWKIKGEQKRLKEFNKQYWGYGYAEESCKAFRR